MGGGCRGRVAAGIGEGVKEAPTRRDRIKMLTTLQFSHTFLAAGLIFQTSSSAGSSPSPIPAQLWIVTPPTLTAAIPVEA